MIKDLINLFKRYNSVKTYNLGHLQKKGLIILDDIGCCPNCGSKNIILRFYIPTDGSKPNIDPEEVCKDCRYGDKKGGFANTNFINIRNNKIDKLINGSK